MRSPLPIFLPNENERAVRAEDMDKLAIFAIS